MTYTLALIKSAAVSRGDEHKILEEITRRGFSIVKYRRFQMCPTTTNAFYHLHHKKDYYDHLFHSVTTGPVVALILTFTQYPSQTISQWRQHLGATNSAHATPESLRGMFGGSVHYSHAPIADNALHGSDSETAFQFEASLLFPQ